MNNNRTDENAILSRGKGVFSKTSYITIGTKDQPEPFGRKEQLRSNFVGKQFMTLSSKTGKTPNVYFSKKHDWISDGAQYYDKTRYAEAQKEKSKGFLTGDFSRRDEFSNTIRTEQWREQLKQERKFAETAMAMIEAPMDDTENADANAENATPEEEDFLFDRVFENPNDCFKKTEEASRHSTAQRQTGSMRTTYDLTHQSPTIFEKPKYARKPIVRDTFYRKMNIPFGQY